MCPVPRARNRRMSQSLAFARPLTPRHRTLTPARRVALLAPSADLDPQGCGEAAATARLALALAEIGHQPHIFALSDSDDPITLGQIPVTLCAPRPQVPLLRLGRHWRPGLAQSASHRLLRGALALADALDAHESRQPFHLVHSDAEHLTGYFVPSVAGRPHIVRCSRSPHDEAPLLEGSFDEQASLLTDRRRLNLTWSLLHQVEGLYAPSRYVADRLATHWRRQVGVVRSGHLPCERPSATDLSGKRFVLHVGPFSRLKGSDLLAEAAPQILAACPDFSMLWVDPTDTTSTDSSPPTPWTSLPGTTFPKLPTAQRGAACAALIAHAQAVIVPSRHDNLPAVVLEAMHHGTPVIGTAGASLDEAVRHRRTGLLVPPDDGAALAETVIQHWHQPLAFDWSDPNRRLILDETAPTAAASALMRYGASAGRSIRRRVA